MPPNPNDFKNLDIAAYRTQFFQKSAHTLVDVRTLEEYQDGHIPGALHIPLDELSARLREIPAEKPIVVVCGHGIRSVYGAQIVRYAGFTPVYNLAGGTAAWENARLPLEKPGT
ncbi:MAG: rhodanese-like domain-containing protein [Chloroflexi bacterium]|nr:rhodanese-like domain-containing protein [Chloroflexota bacterium]